MDASKGLSVCEKTGFEIIEFEEAVTKEEGCWLRFVKYPIPATVPTLAPGQAPPKGAPPAKGKGGPSTDDLKTVMGKAWVSFESLKNVFGSKETY